MVRWLPLKRIYYVFDLCWIINFAGSLWVVIEIFDVSVSSSDNKIAGHES